MFHFAKLPTECSRYPLQSAPSDPQDLICSTYAAARTAEPRPSRFGGPRCWQYVGYTLLFMVFYFISAELR